MVRLIDIYVIDQYVIVLLLEYVGIVLLEQVFFKEIWSEFWIGDRLQSGYSYRLQWTHDG